MDSGIVRLLKYRLLRLLVREKYPVAFLVRTLLKVCKADLTLLRDAEHLADRRLGHMVDAGDFGLGQTCGTQLHDESDLNFSGHMIVSFQIEFLNFFSSFPFYRKMVSLCGLPVSFRGFTLFSSTVSFRGLSVSYRGLLVLNGWNNQYAFRTANPSVILSPA